MKKRMVSLLLSLFMLISLFPSAAFAAEGDAAVVPTAAELLEKETESVTEPREEEDKKEEKDPADEEIPGEEEAPADGEGSVDEEDPAAGDETSDETGEKPAAGDETPDVVEDVPTADEKEPAGEEKDPAAEEKGPSGDKDSSPGEAAVADALPEEPAAVLSVERSAALAADDDSRDYPVANLTATAPSYQGGREPALAIDNDSNTSWHTNWDNGNLSNDAANRYIQLELAEATALAALRYLPIGGGTYDNGVVTQYRVEVSADGSSYTSVGSGTWQRGSDWQLAAFDSEVTAKYVRLYGVETYGDTGRSNYFMSAKEIRLVKAPEPVNLSLLEGVTAVASNVEGNNSDAAGAQRAIDGDQTTRWTTDNSGNGTTERSITLDLHRSCEVKRVELYWEKTNATNYVIETSADGQSWTGAVTRTQSPADTHDVLNFDAAVTARYVRLRVIGYGPAISGWWNVSIAEFEVYGTPGEEQAGGLETPSEELTASTPAGNLCRPASCRPSETTTVTPTASSQEAATVAPSKAIDGTIEGKGWSSALGDGPHWLQVDLGKERAVSLVKIFWERGNIKNYKLEGSADGMNWTELAAKTDNTPLTQAQLDTVISFEPVALRYLRVTTTSHQQAGVKRDGTQSVNWNSVCILELEAYKDQDSVLKTAADVLAELTAASFEVSGGHLSVKDDVALDGYTVTFAANLEQVVGADGTVYAPLVDTVVDLDVTVAKDSDAASTPADAPIRVTIPGSHTANEGNPKPAVIPEIMEWYSSSDQQGEKYTLTASSKIVAPAALSGVAGELRADVKDLFGFDLAIASSGAAAGDIELVIGSGAAVAGFDKETYLMEVSDKLVITATDPVGVYWGTRSALQALKLSGDATIDQGAARDYPEFRVRSFMLDVGRKPVSMDMVKEFAKNMAWYKLNDFHIHLSDNLIFMENYCQESDRSDYQSAYEAYSGFRLESGLEEEAGAKPLAAKDYHYTKQEFKDLVEECRAIGIEVIPEIDVPAHAKAITDAFPSLRLDKTGNFAGNVRPWIDHLDLTNKMSESVAKVNEIFDDYIDEDVFDNIVHIGADEYYDVAAKYSEFAEQVVKHILDEKGKKVRMWGSFGYMGDPANRFNKDLASRIQMNIWETGWANPQEMYNKGFQLINIVYNPGYIVPSGSGSRGNYGDRLDLQGVWNFTPNKFGGTWLPASSDQMLGGAYAIWQDNIDTQACGLDEVDTFDRFYEGLPLYSVKLWGEGEALDRTMAEVQADAERIGLAPRSNPYGKVELQDGASQYFRYDFTSESDLSGSGNDLVLTGAGLRSGALLLSGGASYAETGLDRLGWGSKLTFTVYKNAGGGDEQVIFESDYLSDGRDQPYNEFAIKALPIPNELEAWNLGFSRELYDYEFDVELPVGQEVTLTLVNEQGRTMLYVGDSDDPVEAVGKFVNKGERSNTLFRGKTDIGNSSFQFPVARIGSKTNALEGYVRNVSASPIGAGIPVDSDKYDIRREDNAYTASAASSCLSNHNNANGTIEGPVALAVDGDSSTYWHSNYENNGHGPTNLVDLPDQRYIQITLANAADISGLRYQPRPTVANGIVTKYQIKASADGNTWTDVGNGSGSWGHDTEWKMARFDAVNTRYIRLYGVETKGSSGDTPNQFMSAAEIFLCRPPVLDEDGGAMTLPASSPLVGGKAEPAPIVTLDGMELRRDRDYTVSYANNTAEGTATVTVTGVGSYKGTMTGTFTVTAEAAVTDPVELNGENTRIELAETSYPMVGGKAEPKPAVMFTGADGTELALVQGLDYTVSYRDNTAVGEGYVIITGKGEYTGTVEQRFYVMREEQADRISIRSARVTFSKSAYPLVNGKAEPKPTVVFEGATLVLGRDYTLTYYANTAGGSNATVVVTGIGAYTGDVVATFTIMETGENSNNLSRAEVSFDKVTYPLVDGKAEPKPTVTMGAKTLTEGVDYTLAYENNTAPGIATVVITGMGSYIGSARAAFTVTQASSGTAEQPPQGGGSTGGGGGGGSSVTKTETITGSDGAEIRVSTNKFTGVVTATSSYADGTTVRSETSAQGQVIATVTLSQKSADAESKTAVIIPTPTQTEWKPTQVAVIVRPDGTEEVVKTSLPAEDGMRVTLSESATLRIVDNAKAFSDISPDYWANEAVSFVTSREIFNGTGSGVFSPHGDMSRAMVCTVLANLEGVKTSGGSTWYDKAVEWAVKTGVSDGTNPDAIVTREQLAVMLYRYIGSPETGPAMPEDTRFADTDQISDWAVKAMIWAVEKGILKGRDGVYLAPQATASRAEVAAMMQRYISLL